MAPPPIPPPGITIGSGWLPVGESGFALSSPPHAASKASKAVVRMHHHNASFAPAYDVDVRCAVVVVFVVGCGFSARNADMSSRDAALGDGDGPTIVDAPDASNGSSCTMHAVPPSLSVDAMQWHAAFLTAPVWSCNAAGTTTINSTMGTVVSTSCALGATDVTN